MQLYFMQTNRARIARYRARLDEVRRIPERPPSFTRMRRRSPSENARTKQKSP